MRSLGRPERGVERALDQVLDATTPLLDGGRARALPLNRHKTQRVLRRLTRRRRDLE